MLEVFGKCSQPVCFHGDGEWLSVLELFGGQTNFSHRLEHLTCIKSYSWNDNLLLLSVRGLYLSCPPSLVCRSQVL
ncbi:hypothetical protein F2P79_004991 [Pimephales promelas]|nr:hypothetical protein F2P79_004991 [Pimephales promelas]